MIARRTVFALGLSQLISWGVTFYLIRAFGEQIATDLHWKGELVYGGFSAALLTMGVMSPLAGRLMDRYGGRWIMNVGALANGVGCIGLGLTQTIAMYFASWILIGIGMRLTLYDAAFAAIARIGGPKARVPMSQITLLGGLSSSVFWPLGHFLSLHVGWRSALFVYAGIATATIPLHFFIPNNRFNGTTDRELHLAVKPRALSRRAILTAGSLFAVITAGVNCLHAGMSAYMIPVLAGLGVASSVAVWIATLRGLGQSAARLCEVAFGRKIDPLTLNLVACAIMPLSFLLGLFSGTSEAIGFAFAFLNGACNGILTITRGTVPLALFDHRSYGALVGTLIAPSFILSAATPVAYALLIDNLGGKHVLHFSIGIALVTLLAAVLLRLMFKSAEHESGC